MTVVYAVGPSTAPRSTASRRGGVHGMPLMWTGGIYDRSRLSCTMTPGLWKVRFVGTVISTGAPP